MSKLRALFIMGTRPEAIKIAPLMLACQRFPNQIEPILCSTGQHKEMLQQVVDYFGLKPDVDLGLMRPNQTLSGLTARCIEAIDETLVKYEPDCLVAQGDTTTVMAASLASFYRKTPFVHVEAGLRTGNLYSPWPEELNRRVAGIVTTLHCAPTQRSADNLLREGVDPKSVHITGNTVVDALLWTVQRERMHSEEWSEKYAMLGDRRMTLITGHRRENFGQGFENICHAIAELATSFPETEFVYPVHLNPNVQQPVHRILGSVPNVHLTKPASYPEFVWLMDRAYLILTDSGGVQEEAPSLKKPVLVMRDTTERPEAVDAGAVQLVGTSTEAIVIQSRLLLENEAEYAKRQLDFNPYGDGKSAQRILNLMLNEGWQQATESVRRAA